MSVAMRYFRRIMSLANAWVASCFRIKAVGECWDGVKLPLSSEGAGANELIVHSQTTMATDTRACTIQAGSLFMCRSAEQLDDCSQFKTSSPALFLPR